MEAVGTHHCFVDAWHKLFDVCQLNVVEADRRQQRVVDTTESGWGCQSVETLISQQTQLVDDPLCVVVPVKCASHSVDCYPKMMVRVYV